MKGISLGQVLLQCAQMWIVVSAFPAIKYSAFLSQISGKKMFKTCKLKGEPAPAVRRTYIEELLLTFYWQFLFRVQILV